MAMRAYLKDQKYSKRSILIGLLCVFALNLSCKKQSNMTADEANEKSSIVEKHDVNRIEPLNWWVGFKNPKLQILVHHPNISATTPEISYQGVSIEKVHKADSPNYLFIDLVISEVTKAGKFNIIFKEENKDDLVHTYELKSREKSSEDYMGFHTR